MGKWAVDCEKQKILLKSIRFRTANSSPIENANFLSLLRIAWIGLVKLWSVNTERACKALSALNCHSYKQRVFLVANRFVLERPDPIGSELRQKRHLLCQVADVAQLYVCEFYLHKPKLMQTRGRPPCSVKLRGKIKRDLLRF